MTFSGDDKKIDNLGKMIRRRGQLFEDVRKWRKVR